MTMEYNGALELILFHVVWIIIGYCGEVPVDMPHGVSWEIWCDMLIDVEGYSIKKGKITIISIILAGEVIGVCTHTFEFNR